MKTCKPKHEIRKVGEFRNAILYGVSVTVQQWVVTGKTEGLKSKCRRFSESCFVLFQVQATLMSNSKLAVGYCTSPRPSTGN